MDDNRVVATLQKQNEILSDISTAQRKTRFSPLKVLVVFGLGFALGSVSHIRRKLCNEIDSTFNEIWRKRKNDIIDEMTTDEQATPTDSQE